VGYGPVGGNGIIVRVLQIHSGGGTKHKLLCGAGCKIKTFIASIRPQFLKAAGEQQQHC
jgi:hypothetical protein